MEQQQRRLGERLQERNVLQMTRETFKNIPARFVFGFLQSLCYGWLTDMRFRHSNGGDIRSCVFCCGGCNALDDFYHYAECPVVWHAWNRLGLSRPDNAYSRSLRTLLLLDGQYNLELRVVFLHSTMVAVHKLRKWHAHVASTLREKYLRDTFKDQICSDGQLKNAFRSIWHADVLNV